MPTFMIKKGAHAWQPLDYFVQSDTRVGEKKLEVKASMEVRERPRIRASEGEIGAELPLGKWEMKSSVVDQV